MRKIRRSADWVRKERRKNRAKCYTGESITYCENSSTDKSPIQGTNQAKKNLTESKSNRINKGLPPESYTPKLVELQEIELKNFKQDLGSNDCEKWRRAIKEELKSSHGI